MLADLIARVTADPDLSGSYRVGECPPEQRLHRDNLWRATIIVKGPNGAAVTGYGLTRQEALDRVAGWILKDMDRAANPWPYGDARQGARLTPR